MHHHHSPGCLQAWCPQLPALCGQIQYWIPSGRAVCRLDPGAILHAFHECPELPTAPSATFPADVGMVEVPQQDMSNFDYLVWELALLCVSFLSDAAW